MIKNSAVKILYGRKRGEEVEKRERKESFMTNKNKCVWKLDTFIKIPFTTSIWNCDENSNEEIKYTLETYLNEKIYSRNQVIVISSSFVLVCFCFRSL